MSAAHTMERLLDLAALPADAIPASARRMADFSLFDWMVVGRAGAAEPISRIVRDFIGAEAGAPVATVIGGNTRAAARAAALANGTISHALDYDDTHFAHIGHPSVAIWPAALATAEQMGLPAAAARDAFLIGAEASCRIGMVLGRRHYERGFHQTATAGAFGATVAAGRLLGLKREQLTHALSLVATRASGLKSQFGTMGKPFNAGIAASNGVEAALLASLGFVSCDDGIGDPQGFVLTHTDDPSDERGWADAPPGRFVFEDISYKLHACCHGTHAMLNAIFEARRQTAIGPDQVARVTVRTNPRWLAVCDIKAPRTGLEIKFSYVFLAAMALHGMDTAADRIFTDALCGNTALQGTAQRVQVAGDASLTDTQVAVDVTLASGITVAAEHDLSKRLPTEMIEQGLRTKARGLLGEDVAENLWSSVVGLDQLSARALGEHLV